MNILKVLEQSILLEEFDSKYGTDKDVDIITKETRGILAEIKPQIQTMFIGKFREYFEGKMGKSLTDNEILFLIQICLIQDDLNNLLD